ncbi:MAG: arsenate reductase ArsC [Steroidobacteraceae bacterium]|jgi:hypothetical protein
MGRRAFQAGEVTVTSSIVKPLVLEYRADDPGVYALEALPIYDAIARVKVHGHWQSDVIAAYAIDSAAGEVCPVWPDHPMTAHWGVADPAAVEGSDAAKARAFREAFETLQARIKAFVRLPIEQLGPAELKAQLAEIGKLRSSEAA